MAIALRRIVGNIQVEKIPGGAACGPIEPPTYQHLLTQHFRACENYQIILAPMEVRAAHFVSVTYIAQQRSVAPMR
jgi:hypothetical protein